MVRMSSEPSRLPRRHRQRLSLRRIQDEPSRKPSNQAQSNVYESRIGKKKSSLDWDIHDLDSDHELDHDSGYCSGASDTEARYLEQKMQEFEEAGPTLSNHSDSTVEAIETEERKWQQYVSALAGEEKPGVLIASC